MNSAEGYDVLLEAHSGHSWPHRAYFSLAVSPSVRLVAIAGEGDEPGGDSSLAERADGVVAALDAALGTLTRDPVPTDDGPGSQPRVTPPRTVVVWIAGGAAARPALTEQAELEVTQGADAVAVMSNGARYETLPPAIGTLHAIPSSASHTNAAYEVLAAAGVVPIEQALFISYSHRDGTPLARALFDVLQRARFDAFLDTARLDPGRRFDERLEHALTDKAFLLLVESEEAVRSKWVRREVTYAQCNRLGLAAVRPHGANRQIWGFGASRRLFLGEHDLTDEQLSDEAEARVLDFVRPLHSQAMVRRRAQIENSLLQALEDHGLSDGVDVHRHAGGFRVHGGRDYAVGLKPRPVDLMDFERVDRRRLEHEKAVLVSPGTRGAVERRALEWLSSRSRVVHAPEGRAVEVAEAMSAGSL